MNEKPDTVPIEAIPREAVIRVLQSLTPEEEAQILRTVLKIDEMPPEKLKEMILRIGPNDEVRAGKQMMLRLLESSGPEGVAAFVAKAQTSIRRGFGLSLEYDFDALEGREYARSRGYSRRLAIPMIFFGVPGLAYMAESVCEKGAMETDPNSAAHKFYKAVENELAQWHWAYNGMIGFGLFHEAFVDKMRQVKLEQVADMVTEMVDHRNRANQEQSRSR